MRGVAIRFWCVLLIAVLGVGAAQSGADLVVNGTDVPGMTLGLVPNVSYAPASAFAEALGAELLVDHSSGLATLRMGGRTVVLGVHSDPGAAADDLLLVGAESRPGGGAVLDDGRLFLPVAAVTRAFGGYTTLLTGGERNQVLAVLPRARLTELTGRRSGESERIIATLTQPAPFSVYRNEPLGAVELTFERTDAVASSRLSGEFFSAASLLASRGSTTLRVALEPGVDYSVFTTPLGGGYQVVIDLFEERTDEVARQEGPPRRVVIDPGHGGEDAGLRLGGERESAVTLAFAEELAAELRRRGFDVSLTRLGDADVPLTNRSGMGVGAELFLSIHVGDLAEGEYELYYLGDPPAETVLELAVRKNAEAELPGTSDRLRRQVLLDLIPDLDAGRRYAQALSNELYAGAGLRAGEPRAAPLQVLSGAAGRGLLVEMSVGDLRDPGLPARFAAAVATVLGRR